jgi:excisionase family DNA binding protein
MEMAKFQGAERAGRRHVVLTVREVSGLLRVSTPKTRRLILAGDLPGFRIGREFRIPVAQVQALLGGQR